MNIIKILLSCLAITVSLAFTSSLKKDDFEIVRERVIAEVMKDKVDDSVVASIISMLNDDGSFKEINYDDLSRTAGFPHRRHTYNLVLMAKAYKQKSSSYYKSKKLKQQIITSLKYWVDNDFFGDNWHNNQISTPTNLVNLMLVIGDQLPEDLVEKAQPIIGRAHMNASGARPSGDRIVIAGILAKNLLFIRDKERFDEIIRIIEGEVKFSTGSRGMQHDYSFHHRVDRVNNTTSYGYGKYANAFGEWSYYVANTKYAFSVEKINHLVDYYLDGIYKQMVYGVYVDISVKNRSISHKTTFEPRGTLEIDRLLFSTDYRNDELEQIKKLRLGEAENKLSFSKFFWQTEHFVIQRPNYYTTVRMYSTRNRNMEVPYNGPGKTTHHRADGTNYLMLRGDEYHNIWPVYNWQMVSGTTVLQKPELHGPQDIQKDGLTDFVGGISDGMIGAAVFDFKSPHDMTEAKKSWFFFDNEYVCLGAAISSNRRDMPVYTTINQVLLRSDVHVEQDGIVKKLDAGSHEMESIKWIHQDKIGYILPQAANINISNQTESGRWSDITDQKNISTEIVQKDVFSLWFDHGERPRDATYQYIVVPDVTQEELKSSSSDNRGIKIISNTEDLQAVWHSKNQISQLVFYRGGEIDMPDGTKIEMDSQGMAMVEMNGGRISKLTVADPSRKLSKMHITVSGTYSSGDNYEAYPDAGTGNTSLTIDLPQGVYAGESVTVSF